MKGNFSTIIIILILILTSISSIFSSTVAYNDTWIPSTGTITNLNTSDVYSVIQNAIDNASPGNHLFLSEGEWDENLYIDKTLTIEGDSMFTTIIDNNALSVDIWGNPSWNEDIIFLDHAEHVSIKNISLKRGRINLTYAHHPSFYRVNFNSTGFNYTQTNYSYYYENNFTGYSYLRMYDGDFSSYGSMTHNNFFDDARVGIDSQSSPPSWYEPLHLNETYPQGGNYWVGNTDAEDFYSGPNQDIPGSDGFDDTGHYAGRGDKDWYPLMEPVEFGIYPPTITNPNPSDGTTNISTSITQVSIDISDTEPFDWTIEGEHIIDTGATDDTSGTKTANIFNSPLPYGTEIIWYVNATDGRDNISAVYSFTVELYISEETYVDDDYDESTSGYGETHFNTIQTAIESTEEEGIVNIQPGIYSENLRILKPLTLQGEDKETTVIIGRKQNPPPYDSGPGSTLYLAKGNNDKDIYIQNLTIYNENDGHMQSTCISISDEYVPVDDETENIYIRNCEIAHSYFGVLFYNNVKNVEITDCLFDCRDIATYGVLLGGKNNIVSHCIFNGDGPSGATAGINIQPDGEHLDIYTNTFTDLYIGIQIIDGDYIKIYSNTIQSCDNYGIDVTRAYNSKIYNNNLMQNNPLGIAIGESQIYQEHNCDTLYWNETYPDGGNYYSDFDEVDEGAMDIYRGPNQEIPGVDGIVDAYHCMNPYEIDGADAEDFYPLINPYEAVMMSTSGFIWDPTVPLVDEWVTFTALDEGAYYEWDFGDGTEGEGKETYHQYEEVGKYSVTLVTAQKDGYIDIYTDTIYVLPNNPFIIPPRVAKYPGYTVPEMYNLMRTDKLPSTNKEVSVMVIDSGVRQGTYENFSFTDNIISMHHPNYQDSDDGYGHGTFCNYEVGYILKEKLPNAKQYSYKAFGTNGETSSTILLEALDEAKNKNVDIVSLSAGALGNPNDALSRKVKELRDAGIIVICAAGNFGPKASTVLSPACSDYTLSVAGSDPGWYGPELTEDRRIGVLNLADDTLADWSSRGPVPQVYPKPDVTAPGESIIGPWSSAYQNGIIETNQSGTSMATPLVAGGTAVIIAHNKGTIDTIKTIRFWDKASIVKAYEDAVRESCYKKGGVDGWGAGIVQMDVINEQFQSNLQNLFLLTILEIIIVPISIIASIFIFIRWRTGTWNPFTKKPWYTS